MLDATHLMLTKISSFDMFTIIANISDTMDIKGICMYIPTSIFFSLLADFLKIHISFLFVVIGD